MPAILIKDVPTDVHAWLKEEAARNRRSMTQQAVVLLEALMTHPRAIQFPSPLALKGVPLTFQEIDHAKKEGRA